MVVLGLAWHQHRARACAVGDGTLGACTAAQGPEAVGRLQQRIGENPGDSAAYVELARSVPPSQRASAVRSAAALAPRHPAVQQLQVAQAFEQGRLDQAAALLAQLSGWHHHGNPLYTRLLAELAISPQGAALLRPHLDAGGARWLPNVLRHLVAQKSPMAMVQPLVVEAHRNGLLGAQDLQGYSHALKASGAWTDAYGLWLARNGGRLPLLYNPGFEQHFVADGFDWEAGSAPPARAGALAERSLLAGRGHVLEVKFTGRPIDGPPIRQMLFLAPGRYQFSGQYMGTRLRTEHGVAWTLRCTAGSGAEAGRTDALMATEGRWESFSAQWRVAAGCGPVASLQLEAAKPYEATAGLRGMLDFDGFELRFLGP